jgi:hypothetical protein
MNHLSIGEEAMGRSINSDLLTQLIMLVTESEQVISRQLKPLIFADAADQSGLSGTIHGIHVSQRRKPVV